MLIVRMVTGEMMKSVQHHLSSYITSLLKVVLNDSIRCYTAKSRPEQYNLHRLVSEHYLNRI